MLFIEQSKALAPGFAGTDLPRIDIDQEDDGQWLAEIPALPGVMAYGETREAAQTGVEALASPLACDQESYII